jgi:putative transposase
MSEYRRHYVPGGTYFFTVKTFKGCPILLEESYRTALRQAIRTVQSVMPFQNIAWVLLPDHLHTVWILPESDANFSLRWALIKQRVTHLCIDRSQVVPMTESRQRRREGTIWQRRFWEHAIRDDTDLRTHIDYIHYNPVKHGYVTQPGDWPYSTFHRYVRAGVYPKDWASADLTSASDYGE